MTTVILVLSLLAMVFYAVIAYGLMSTAHDRVQEYTEFYVDLHGTWNTILGALNITVILLLLMLGVFTTTFHLVFIFLYLLLWFVLNALIFHKFLDKE